MTPAAGRPARRRRGAGPRWGAGSRSRSGPRSRPSTRAARPAAGPLEAAPLVQATRPRQERALRVPTAARVKPCRRGRRAGHSEMRSRRGSKTGDAGRRPRSHCLAVSPVWWLNLLLVRCRGRASSPSRRAASAPAARALHWWMLAPAFFVAERCVVHLHFRRERPLLLARRHPARPRPDLRERRRPLIGGADRQLRHARARPPAAADQARLQPRPVRPRRLPGGCSSSTTWSRRPSGSRPAAVARRRSSPPRSARS